MKQTAAKAILTVVGSYMYFRNARIIFQFRRKMGYWPDVSTPARYNEKLLWRKLFDHNPRFTRLSNRAAAQEYLVEKAGHRMSFAPRIWMGDDIQTMPDEVFEAPTVLKALHGSGWNVFIEDDQVERNDIRQLAENWLARRYGVRRQGFWHQRRLKLRESSAHLVDCIMRRACCDASVAFRVSFV